jgi:hypothetical protein
LAAVLITAPTPARRPRRPLLDVVVAGGDAEGRGGGQRGPCGVRVKALGAVLEMVNSSHQ